METGPAPAQKRLTTRLDKPIDRLPPLEREREKSIIEARRKLVGEMRFAEGLTLQQISDRLKKAFPDEQAMHVSLPTISQDLGYVRRAIQKQWTTDFNPLQEFTRLINRYEILIQRALRESHETTDAPARVAWTRTAVDIQAKMLDTYVEAGIINKTIVQQMTVKPDDGKVVERIPSGEEVRAWFQRVGVVKDEELISDAQRAYMYGDEAVDGEVVE